MSQTGECEVAPIQLKGGSSQFNSLTISNFKSLTHLRNGGAVSLFNAQLLDTNSVYRNNSAAEGGALYLD